MQYKQQNEGLKFKSRNRTHKGMEHKLPPYILASFLCKCKFMYSDQFIGYLWDNTKEEREKNKYK